MKKLPTDSEWWIQFTVLFNSYCSLICIGKRHQI